MDTHRDRTPPDTPPTGPDVRIEATNFGPIGHVAVDLRPLTVFVGPSNTGKTYLAVLIYALHRILEGFRRFPVPAHAMYEHFLFSERDLLDKLVTDVVFRKEFRDLLDKLDADGTSFRLSDLPERVRDAIRTSFMHTETLQTEIEREFKRCFDVESVSDLARLPGRRMNISLVAKTMDRNLWNFHADVSQSGVTADGLVEEVLFPETGPQSAFARRFRFLMKQLRPRIADSKYLIEAFFRDVLFTAARSDESHQRNAYYLPAARSGIMQSHRVIASSLVTRSTRAGMERFPELPTFSGVIADFMQWLILYEKSDSVVNSTIELAAQLERETLAGRIRIKQSTSGGYPEFVYCPWETEQDVRLTRASSMVSELAPVVLFLRGGVGQGDTLVIEEPEAHLHPAAQTRMAVVLARLVRAGVRVVVTTHSDWLLKEIGNLMRAGALTEAGRPPVADGPPSALRREEVGIWLFRKDGSASGSTVEEIPFDAVEGVEPPDYEAVAEALYNRSADLQNQLEDVAKGGSRGSE